MNFVESIEAVLAEVKTLLIEKNRSYGDSALNPIKIFSKLGAAEALRVRIDDKLSRLVRGDLKLSTEEDVVLDLLGYFVLLRIENNTPRQSIPIAEKSILNVGIDQHKVKVEFSMASHSDAEAGRLCRNCVNITTTDRLPANSGVCSNKENARFVVSDISAVKKFQTEYHK